MENTNNRQKELTKCTESGYVFPTLHKLNDNLFEDAVSCGAYRQNARYRNFKNPALNRIEMILIGTAWGGLWGASADIAFHMSETFLIAGMATGALAMVWVLNRFYKHSEDGNDAGRDA